MSSEEHTNHFCRAFKKYKRHYNHLEKGRIVRDVDTKEYNERVARHRKHAWQCLAKTSILLVLVLACDTIQVFAIMDIQHCHHEAFLGLYWPLWTLLGLGSTIAMIGTLVNIAYCLTTQKLPPYGTALGTPVLVVCSIGHFLYHWIPHKLGRGSGSQDV
jgi:hypothetical protein